VQSAALTILVTLTAGLLGASTVSTMVPIPEEASSATRLTLHIEGLRLPPGKNGIVEIYAGEAATREEGPDKADYVGYIAPVPRNSREAERGVVIKGAVLDLTPKIENLRDKKQVSITLVLAGGDAPQWDRIYITGK
jgi:hypothetical protein